jgi:hypothetical protein
LRRRTERRPSPRRNDSRDLVSKATCSALVRIDEESTRMARERSRHTLPADRSERVTEDGAPANCDRGGIVAQIILDDGDLSRPCDARDAPPISAASSSPQ